jgi:hypothetical protein
MLPEPDAWVNAKTPPMPLAPTRAPIPPIPASFSMFRREIG